MGVEGGAWGQEPRTAPGPARISRCRVLLTRTGQEGRWLRVGAGGGGFLLGRCSLRCVWTLAGGV